MQNNSISQKIVNIVWNYINYNRGTGSLMDLYISALYILYGIHKDYPVEFDEDDVYFDVDDTCDYLLRDLREINEQRILYFKRRSLFSGLKEIDHDSFEECYRSVINELNHKMSMSMGKTDGDFYTPEALNSLISFFVNMDGCETVYDPFCGTASILHHLTDNYENLIYFGQDKSPFATLLARVNYEACFGDDSHIDCKDSINDWSVDYYDAVISCPPLGVKLSGAVKDRLYDEFHYDVKSLEELFFLRALYRNDPDLMICLTSLVFSYRDGEKAIRKELVDKNILDTIVSLPSNLLYNTSAPCLLFVCKKYRDENEPIKFIHAEGFIAGNNKQERTFDMHRFTLTVESELPDYCVPVKKDEICSYDYNLNPALYINKNYNLSEGQIVLPLNQLLSLKEGNRAEGVVGGKTIIPAKMSANFIRTMLNKNKVDEITEGQARTRFKFYELQRGETLLLISEMGGVTRYALYDDFNTPLYCAPQINVFSVNNTLVTPEYLAYTLLNHKAINKGHMHLSVYMKLPIVIDSLSDQKEIINKISQEHAAAVRAEQEADAKRLGVKTNISDLEHMLGTTYANIDDILYKLDKIKAENATLNSLVRGLRDNVEYLKRVIRYDNANISSEEFNLREQDIEEFIKSYCNGWINYSGNYFGLSLNINLGDNKKVVFDKTLLKVMFDSVLNNVERHGFDKRRNDDNHVEISLSIELYRNKPYVIIRVANNGTPFKKGFTINDYITRGRYSASTGRSGLGGYHVYSIIKGHGGYLYIDSNKIWNVIIEILLPIENVELDNLIEYENECI